MSTVSQRLLAELFHEDNVDGVLFHQDSVILKGCASDDSRNYVGSLLLVQKRPVGAKRRFVRVPLPQPNYLVWLPYSYLYCLASHLLSPNARRAIDSDPDLMGLTTFTARLKNAVADLDAASAGGSGGGLSASPPSPSSPAAGATSTVIIPDAPQRLDWQHTLCIPISHILKFIRKSNIRGRRVLTTVRRESLAMESPLIFEDGGMSRLFDELKKVCHVELRPGAGQEEAFVSREIITCSTPNDADEEDDDASGVAEAALVGGGGGGDADASSGGVHPALSNGGGYGSPSSIRGGDTFKSGGSGAYASPDNGQDGSGRAGRAFSSASGGGSSAATTPSHSGRNHPTPSNNIGGGGSNNYYYGASDSGASSSANRGRTYSSGNASSVSGSGGGGGGGASSHIEFADTATVHERLYGSGGGGLLSSGFKSKATAAAEREREQGGGATSGASGGGGRAGGFMSTMLSIGATFARSAKAAIEDGPNEADVNGRYEYGTGGGGGDASRARHGSSGPSSSAAGRRAGGGGFSRSESDYDFAEVGDSGANLTRDDGSPYSNNVTTAKGEENNAFIHGDGTVRRHHEPQAPVLRMPLNSRKLAPPLGRIDWRSAFDGNINSVRLTSTANPASSAAAPTSGGQQQPSTPTTNGGGGGAPSFPSVLPKAFGASGDLSTSSPAEGSSTAAASPAAACSSTANPNLIPREIAYGGTGTLRDEAAFHKLRVKAYNGTIADDIRPQVWAYLLGVFPVGSSPAERKVIMERHEAEYSTLLAQWRSIFPQQEARFGAYREHKIAIEKDVMRTDRNHPDFKDDDSPKLRQLRNVLMSYAMFNFDLGYCQGMSDVLAILLLIYTDDEVMCYAAFKQLLSTKMEGNFRTDMKRNIEVHLREVQLLIERFAPDLYKHLVSVGAEQMTFTFRWLLILFKREFNVKSVIKLWDIIFSSPHTPHFEALIAAAILSNVGHQIIEQKLAYDEILKFANLMSNQFDVHDVIMLSHDFYTNVTQQLSSAMRAAAVKSGDGAAGGGAGGDEQHQQQQQQRPRGSSFVHAAMMGGGGGGGIVGDSGPQRGATGGVAQPSAAAAAAAAAANVRPTLPEIIAFLAKEQKSSSSTANGRHSDPYGR